MVAFSHWTPSAVQLPLPSPAGVLGVALLLWAGAAPLGAQQIHRNLFESDEVSWVQGPADVAYVEKEHLRTDQGAQDGQRAEYIHIDAKQGSHVYYQYAVGRAPLSDELSASVWVKANQPNIQLLARVVLPNERDPRSLNDRLTTLIRGDVYRTVGRYKILQLPRVVKLAQEQQRVMQQELGRPVSFQGAYIDRLILNVYGGPGRNEVWIDNLEIGPVEDPVPAPPVAAGEGRTDTPVSGGPPRPPRDLGVVEFDGSQLLVNKKRFFIRGIRHSDTPLRVLRNAGFNTVWFDHGASPALLREAADFGFRLVPSLQVAEQTSQLVSRQALAEEVHRFPEPGSVLMWELGGSLAYEQAAQIGRAAQVVRTADPGRPVGADVWDGFRPYSRSLNLVGAHRWPLMTALELTAYRDWLDQRRLLANPGTYMWTWVQTHTPEFFSQLLYDRPSSDPFPEPVGPQPAQIRLLTYLALGAGCRGVGFCSDRFLADTHQGRDRLLAVALLNKELEMLEPLLVTVNAPPSWIGTSEPDVKAAVFNTAKGFLVLPMWLGKGAQFVPGQSATTNLKIVVPPEVPQGTQAWEVTPGEVRSLRSRRTVGGTEVTLPEFGMTTAVVFTSDTNLIVRFQEHTRGVQKMAAQWTYNQAVQELEKVTRVQRDLESTGHAVADTSRLLQAAREQLAAAKGQWDSHLYSEAYRDGQRALRPLRLLMRAQWEDATAGLDSPVAVPYAVSYYTLPRFWKMVDEVRGLTAAANVLPGGDFESPPRSREEAWFPQKITLDDVELRPERVGEKTGGVAPKEGKTCAMLKVAPKEGTVAPRALERTYLAVNSPAVNVPPGTIVRVSCWLHIPEPIQASVDGVLFFDSIGGEPLAVRLTEKTPWKKISLYRRVPPSGTVSVSLALSGIGTVYFDDVRVEPMTATTQVQASR